MKHQRKTRNAANLLGQTAATVGQLASRPTVYDVRLTAGPLTTDDDASLGLDLVKGRHVHICARTTNA